MSASNLNKQIKKWCVQKFPKDNDLLIISLSDVLKHDSNWRQPEERTFLVPDELNTLVGEIKERIDSTEQEEEFYGLDLLDILMNPEHSSTNAGPVCVLKQMLPRIMWWIAYNIWAITDFYEQNESAIEELVKKLSSETAFPKTLTQVEDMLTDIMPEHKYYCIARDKSFQMAMKERESDSLPGKHYCYD